MSKVQQSAAKTETTITSIWQPVIGGDCVRCGYEAAWVHAEGPFVIKGAIPASLSDLTTFVDGKKEFVCELCRKEADRSGLFAKLDEIQGQIEDERAKRSK